MTCNGSNLGRFYFGALDGASAVIGERMSPVPNLRGYFHAATIPLPLLRVGTRQEAKRDGSWKDESKAPAAAYDILQLVMLYDFY